MPKTHISAGDAAGLVFTPRDAPAPGTTLPLVLLGHGAHTGKDDLTMQALCWGLAYGVPSAVLCLDAPGHGERKRGGITDGEFDRLVRDGMGDAATHVRFANDWQAAAKAARATVDGIDDRTGYAGFSMGAVFGASIAARVVDGPVVLAVGGLRGADADRGEDQNTLMRAGVAQLVDRPVIMLNMTRDEHFQIELAIELFESLPTRDKRMLV